jgi:acetyl esterase
MSAGRSGRDPAGVAAVVAATAAFLPTLGVLAPRTPVVGVLGAALSGSSARVAAGALAVLASSVALDVRRPSPLRTSAVVISGGAVIGALAVARGLDRFARGRGVRLRMLEGPGRAQQPDAVVDYAAEAGRTRSICIWYPTAPSEEPAPVVLYVHGGGWISGAATDHSADKRWFARNGLLVLSVEYTLSTKEDHRWDVTAEEVEEALRWAVQHVEEHGGRKDRIVLMGDSAGGNLALDVANRADRGQQPRPVAAVVALYPVVDPVAFHDDPDPLLGRLARSMTEQHFGGSPAERPERYRAATSARLVGPGSPPTLLFVPAHDHLVPPASALEYAAALHRTGARCEVVLIPFAEHVFNAFGVGAQLFREITLHWIRQQLAGTGSGR